MNDLFEFTSGIIDKKLFESLKDYPIYNQEEKVMLLSLFNRKGSKNKIEEFMLFENKKKKDFTTYKEIKNEVESHLKNRNFKNEDISIIRSDNDKFYAIHTKLHYIGELEKLVSPRVYEMFIISSITPLSEQNHLFEKKTNEAIKATEEFIFEFMKSSGTARDPGQEELKKRRKKRK